MDGDTHSLAETTDGAPLAGRARRRDHGIRVVFERADGVVCSQVFVTIESAERKVGKVRERGLQAQMQLVRLVPVGIELDTTTVPSSAVDLLDGGWSE